MKRICIGVVTTVMMSGAWAVGAFPNSDLVIKFINKPQAIEAKMASCTSVARGDPAYPECWGAQKAAALMERPADTRELVLNPAKRKETQAKCDAMSMKERFEARSCQALGQASNFFMFLGSPYSSSFIRF